MKTTQAKHTPGPWYVEQDGDAWKINSDECGIALVHDPIAIELDRADEIEANARLIAAAPELLEALDELTTLLLPDNPKPKGGLCETCRRLAFETVRAAIAKATT